MRFNDVIGQAERGYLHAIFDLANGKANEPVSFQDVQDYLSCSETDASDYCDFWTNRGAIRWPARGHIALTHLGVAQIRPMRVA
ncbi:MAG: hypothetical protein M1274_08280 [Actinobacteria bacterium]|nr:hypothetical protein [Actinomycetota bacterium]